MKYTVQSCKYITKNFFYIFPLALLPALFLTFSTDEEALVCLVETIFSGKLSDLHFAHIFRAISVLNFASAQSLIFGVLGIAGMIVFVALIMAFLEKHMRIGKRTFNGLLYKLNDNFMSTCGYAFLFLAIYEIWTLLTASLLYFVTRISVAVLAYIFAIIVYLGMHVLLIHTISGIYLWLPCMQFTGFRALEALHYSYQLVAPVKRGILAGQLTCFLLAETLICICVMFTANPVMFTVWTTIVYAVLLMIYCVRMQIAYFDRDKIERADLSYYSK